MGLTESLIKAINKAIAEAPFDKTIPGIVESLEDGVCVVRADGGQYRIQTSSSFSVGEAVRICFPRNAKHNPFIVGESAGGDPDSLMQRVENLILALQENPDYAPTAEIVDGRSGYDGTQHPLIGDAIRAIGYDLLSLEESLSDYIDKEAVDGLYYEDSNLYLTAGGKIVSDPIKIVSGSGGGGGGAAYEYTVSLNNLLDTRVITVATGSKVELKFSYSSVDADGYTDGNGIGKFTVNGASKPAVSIAQGENTFDITSMLSVGENTVKLRVDNSEGSFKTLTYTVNIVSATITSPFDVSSPFSGDIDFYYVPNGAVEKTVYFEVDGEVIGTQVVTYSGKQQMYTIPAQSHGSHSIRVWFDCTVEGVPVTSNKLYFEFASIEEGNTTSIITSNFLPKDVTQYDTVVIPYRVYTPNSLTSTIDLLANNSVIGNDLVVDRTEQYWSYRADTVGTHEMKIQCGSTARVWSFTAADANIDVEAETNNLALHLTSYGRSNNEATPGIWSYGNISSTFSNFNFVSDGWQIDEDGVSVLRVTGDARLEIPATIFANDFRPTGKTIEIEFASRDVLDYDAVIISCMSEGKGIQITSQRADLFSTQSAIGTQYKENEHIRITFVVEKQADNRFILIYVNGILSGAEVYPKDDNFAQFSPVGISIGSNLCTTDIYCIRVYDNNLTRYQILDNWIADTQNGSLMIERYHRNQVYNDALDVAISELPADLPYLVIESTALPQFKGDKKTCSGYYVDVLNPSRSFSFTNAIIDVQGTSSQYYYVKNFKIKFAGGFTLNSGDISDVYQLNDNVIGTNEFTFKADVASSEGANNVVLAQLYNDLCPTQTPPQEVDPRVRQTIDGHPIVIFWNDGTNIIFLGKYNYNLDKGTPEVFGFADGDESWEIRQNGTDLVGWKSDDFSGDWGNDFEARFPEDNTDITNLKAFSTWLVSTNTEAATNTALSRSVTYDGVTYTTDSAEYRVAKFRAELPEHADVDALVFYYLFTEIFLCIDQREKNAFPTLFDAMGKWLMFFYDADSSLGIDNKGKLAFDYYLEDIDYTEGGDPVYNGQGSVLWVNMRKAFYPEIMAMYKEMRVGNKISYDIVNNLFEAHQSKWCEAIFNEDMHKKCLEPMIVDGDGQYLPMLLGKKEMHRKWWLYNRFRFLDSKYITGSSMETRIMIRAKSKANVWLTPYVNMYGHVYYNDEHVEHRMKRGQAYEYVWSATGAEDAVIGINDADMITSLGDLSPLQVETIDVAKAIHLTSLKIGDGASTYSNKNLTSVVLGNNTLLRTLDLRNCSSLNTSIDASGCANIEEVYCEGTSVTGISLPNGGVLRTLHLPATVTNLVVLNQQKITDFSIAGYDKLEVVRVENSDGIPTDQIVDSATNLKRVRLLNVDWTITDATILERLDACGGRDENNNDTIRPVITGKIVVDTMVAASKAEYWTKAFPDVEFTFVTLGHLVTFKDWDGTVLKEQSVADGGNANPPSSPSREQTVQYTYTFTGWDNSYLNITSDVVCTAVYAEALRRYTVRFYNGDTLALEKQVPYGTAAEYTGSSLSKEHENPDLYYYLMSGWYPSVSNITKDIDTYTQWEEKSYPVFQKITKPADGYNYIHFTDGLIFAFNAQSPASNSIYYTSSDTVNWDAHYLPSVLANRKIESIAYVHGYYFVLSQVQYSGYTTYLLYSSDGINWSRSSFSLPTKSYGIKNIIWDENNSVFVALHSYNIDFLVISEDLSMYTLQDGGDGYYYPMDGLYNNRSMWIDNNKVYVFSHMNGGGKIERYDIVGNTYNNNYTEFPSSLYHQPFLIKDGKIYGWKSGYNVSQPTTVEFDIDDIANIVTLKTIGNIPKVNSSYNYISWMYLLSSGAVCFGIIDDYTSNDTPFTLAITLDLSSFVTKTYDDILSYDSMFIVTSNKLIVRDKNLDYYVALNIL